MNINNQLSKMMFVFDSADFVSCNQGLFTLTLTDGANCFNEEGL